VGGAAAVAKEAVFPLFDRLGALHLAIAEELRGLVVRQRLYEHLEQARSQVGAGCAACKSWVRGMEPLGARHASLGCAACKSWVRGMQVLGARHASLGCAACNPWVRGMQALGAWHANLA